MTPPDFHRELTALLNDWCDRRALEPLRIVLPHYPMFNGLTDEVAELARALKTVRAKIGSTLPPKEFDRIVALLHAVEDALERPKRNV
jgi:hypothetical protein